LLQNLIAKLREQFVFERARPLIRAENFALHFLQFRRNETLAVHRRLLANVMLGYAREIGFRDLDEIAEDRGVAHLQRPDACLLNFTLLESRDPIFSLVPGGAKLVERLVISVAENAALLQRERRFIDDGALQKFNEIGELA